MTRIYLLLITSSLIAVSPKGFCQMTGYGTELPENLRPGQSVIARLNSAVTNTTAGETCSMFYISTHGHFLTDAHCLMFLGSVEYTCTPSVLGATICSKPHVAPDAKIDLGENGSLIPVFNPEQFIPGSGFPHKLPASKEDEAQLESLYNRNYDFVVGRATDAIKQQNGACLPVADKEPNEGDVLYIATKASGTNIYTGARFGGTQEITFSEGPLVLLAQIPGLAKQFLNFDLKPEYLKLLSPYDHWIRAPSNAGMSGSPVVNRDGKVVGILTDTFLFANRPDHPGAFSGFLPIVRAKKLLLEQLGRERVAEIFDCRLDEAAP